MYGAGKFCGDELKNRNEKDAIGYPSCYLQVRVLIRSAGVDDSIADNGKVYRLRKGVSAEK